MKFIKILLVIILFSQLAFAGVNLKNGNFYISYTDIVVPGGGLDLEMTRTYNSKATDKGWFGLGWGSDFETHLVVSADGSVIIHENGSGALTRFTPKSPVNAKSAAERIVKAMRKNKARMSDNIANNLIKKLVNDAELRQAYAKKFKVKAKLATGTTLYSNVRGLQQVQKLKDGFKRRYNDGKFEIFNKDGRLTKIQDKNGYVISLNYKNGNVTSIKDSHSKQLFFKWYSDNKIKSLSSAGDKKAMYKFNGNNLIQSVDVNGNIFKYKYDSSYNMTSIKYTDASEMKIFYTRKTQFVSKIIRRNGNQLEYKYGSNPKNPDLHYWTLVTKKDGTGKSRTNRYEYEIKTKPDGAQYTYKILTEIAGIKTETIYSECCSLPEKITRGKHITNFKYNKKGLLIEKKSDRGTFVKLDYHKTFNKITRVENKNGWTSYKYDKKGNLSKAISSKGQSILLVYDRKGRIKKMIDKKIKNGKTRTLTFKYNALGKPVEIAMDKMGKINVAYDNYGEIKKVESKSGQKMALQVTQAFQSLLSIVKPAGVNLKM